MLAITINMMYFNIIKNTTNTYNLGPGWASCFYRETNDNQKDTETVHTIKNVFYNEEVRYNDIAIVELQRSVNDCTDAENQAVKCWPITPALLPSPGLVVRENQRVRALGRICVGWLLSV